MIEESNYTKQTYLSFGIITFVVSIFVGFIVFTRYSVEQYNSHGETLAAEITREEEPSIFEVAMKPIYEPPVELKVESVGIDLNLIEVGVDEDGKLENPGNWDEGGWYYNSAHPGENGNIIINAHYDNNYGAPAAFWQLKNVTVNDKVHLVDSLGRTYTYNVTESFYVDINDPDRLRIFDDVTGRSELTLITCGGVWDSTVGTYNKRLVVKAELDSNADTIPSDL